MELKVIDYETAKLAKDVGFEKGWCDVAYREDDKKLYMDTGMYTDYPAPTQELLRRFLEVKHSIFVDVNPIIGDDFIINFEKGWEYALLIEGEEMTDYTSGFDTYEQALEAGLKEALKYLLNQK